MDAKQLDALTESIIGAAIDVHRELGRGLLENSYEACLCFALLTLGLRVERQKALPVRFKSEVLDYGYRIDLLVEEAVIVEVKAIERFERVHVAQLISYLKFANLQVGLLLNFNVALLSRNGIKRVVNGFPE
jgi:GxxExxY protein